MRGWLGGERGWMGENLSLTRKVKVPNAELRAGDMNGEVNLAATGEILDIAITAVFGAAGDGAGALAADLVLEGPIRAAGVHVEGLGRLRHHAVPLAVGRDELAFAPVPFRQHPR
jgi:hypothetical protein